MSVIPFPDPDFRPADNSPRDRAAGASGTEADAVRDLAHRIAAGSTAALDELIERFWAPLVSYASRILEDADLAEDVVQDVLVRVWEHRDGWAPSSVGAYLFRATRNRALDVMRSRNARHDRERDRATERRRHPRTPAEHFSEARFERIVDEAIQSLPERRREAFTLAYLNDLSYDDVAEVMGISPKTVGNHISAALAGLREKLLPLLREHDLS